ncbi:hypothetical protein J4558_27395 [Leptolyngbya sp. 15MV]|nr:hypothetical protein J4558_27395 [Leptolyngbya sp. 15MV]
MGEGHVAPILAWIEAQAGWAPFLVFLLALVESLPLIGLFVPGSALLLGVGALIGAGSLPCRSRRPPLGRRRSSRCSAGSPSGDC